MIRRYQKFFVLAACIGVVVIAGCKKLTDEHNEITDPSLTSNLMALISANPELSTFAGYVKQTGFDSVLNSSKTFTVYAPVNAALQSLDPAITGNPAKLRNFVGSHIARQMYPVAGNTTKKRILMLDGKYHNILNNKIEDASITTQDKYASNGLLQVIDKALPSLDNAWEFLSNSADAPTKQKNYMLSIFQKVFDTTNAVVIGVNPTTGDPVYQAGTDSVFTNLFWNRVYNLRDESKQFTLFMLTDAAWDAEVARYKKYYATGNPDSTTLLASFAVLRDLAIDTVYDPATIPATVQSKFQTPLPIDRSAIVKTVKTSNGIVYIMNKLSVDTLNKFKEIRIEGENYTGFSNDRRGNTYFRERYNPVTMKNFTDVLVYSHGVSQFNLRYELKEMPSIKYKAYWVALNDFQTATFSQKLGVGTPTAPDIDYKLVDVNVYNEVYVGEFTLAQFRPVFNLYLTAANSTSAAVNPLVCDYIRLVPSL